MSRLAEIGVSHPSKVGVQEWGSQYNQPTCDANWYSVVDVSLQFLRLDQREKDLPGIRSMIALVLTCHPPSVGTTCTPTVSCSTILEAILVILLAILGAYSCFLGNVIPRKSADGLSGCSQSDGAAQPLLYLGVSTSIWGIKRDYLPERNRFVNL